MTTEAGAAAVASGKPAGKKFGQALGIGAKVATGAAVAGIGTALAKGFQRLDAIDKAQAKLKGLGHSAADVEGIMDNALSAVKGTMFGLDEAATTAAGAVAAGVKPGKELDRTLSLVADAATIAGTDLSTMGAIVNKVATADMMQMDVANQLMDAGIPILQMVGDEMGVTAGEARKLASEGKVSFEIFQNALERGVGGAALAAGDTLSGAMSLAGASVARLGENLLKGVYPQLKDFFNNFTEWMGPVEDMGLVIGDKLGAGLEKLTEWVGKNRDWLVKLTGAIGGALLAYQGFRLVKPLVEIPLDGIHASIRAVGRLSNGVQGFIYTARGTEKAGVMFRNLGAGADAGAAAFRLLRSPVDAAKGAMEGYRLAQEGVTTGIRLGTKWTRVGAQLYRVKAGAIMLVSGAARIASGSLRLLWGSMRANPLMWVVGAIGAVVAGLTYFFTKTETGKRVWQSLMDTIKPIIERIGDVVSKLAETAGEAFGRLAETAGETLGNIADVVLPVLVDMGQRVLEAVAPIGEAIVTAFSQVVEALAPALPLFADAGARIAAAFAPLVTQVVEQLVPAFVDLGEALTGIIPQLVETLAPVLPVIADLFSQIVEALGPVVTLFAELFSTIVEALMPVVELLLGALAPVITMVADLFVSLIEAVAPLVTQLIEGLAPVVAGVAEAFTMMMSAVLPAIESIVQAIIPAITTIIEALVAFITMIIEMVIPVIEEILNVVVAVFEAIVPIIQGALTIVQGVIQTITAVIRGDWEAAWGGVKMIFQGVWDTIKAIVTGAMQVVSQVIQSVLGIIAGIWAAIWSQIQGFVFSIWESMKAIVSGAMSWLSTTIQTVLTFIQTTWNTIWGAIKQFASMIWQSITSVVSTAMRSISTVIQSILGFIQSVWSTAWNAVAGVVRSIWESRIRPVFQALGDFFRWVWINVLSPTFDSLKRGWESVSTLLSRVYTSGIKPVFDRFGDIVSGMVGIFETTKNGIKSAWDKVKNVAKQPVKFVLETVINNGLVKGFNKLVSWIPGVNKLEKVPMPAGWAEGGYTGPGIYGLNRKLDPAGVVHAGEFVIKQASTRKLARTYGMGWLENLNRDGRVPGHAKGGTVGWPTRSRSISSGFGAPRGRYPHAGVDFPVPVGTPVYASMAGTVARARTNAVTGRTGLGMLLAHPGNRNTYYGHLSKFIAQVGQKVSKGQKIAESGNTGRSTGPHLHFELWGGGKPVDPAKYLGGSLPEGGVADESSGGGGFNPLSFLTDIGEKIGGWFKDRFPDGGIFVDAAKGLATKIYRDLKEWAQSKLEFIGDLGEKASDWMGDQQTKNKVREIAGKFGWGNLFGEEWRSLNELIRRESSWNPHAKNPHSSAAGLFGLIKANRVSDYNDVEGHTYDGLRYVKNRHGSPSQAIQFWDKHGWYAGGGLVTRTSPKLYDSGGWLAPGVNQWVSNATRAPEAVLTDRQWRDIHKLATRRSERAGLTIYGDVHTQDPKQFAEYYEKQVRRRRAVALPV
ncbi:peptidoglycan DD-metalloendopeptidase family protein [Auritidibacter ignavus]|uniref:aggregation-promoting factor C-terminal-like domain-containing protein n=1 Tax=Auritidibacter ignavus TaxID=678932 RepID=UPI002446A566|nr:peptidoglycan DD-metalloendopeptidase family protein [Auritidibacter ignavus]WGH80600.1 peptidoglycan DD-metalloendopeptidase family protein [Auritidibacter ignavus]